MVLCFDIGGTSIKYGVAHDPGGALVFAAHWETPTDAKTLGGAGVAQKVLDLIGGVCRKYQLSGVGISTAGVVDHRTGEILYANDNIPGYAGINLKTAVERAYGLPCAVENDVNSAALGEAAYGAGKAADSMLCLTVGTGIGGALVLEDKVWHGHIGTAGEIGNLPMHGGTLEQLASVTALVGAVAAQTGERPDGKQIFARAQQGDAVCIDAIEQMCAVLAQGIASCMCVFNPEIVVLGGGIMAQGAYLRPMLARHLQQFANPFVLSRTKIAFAALGNRAGMAGAYRWLRQQANAEEETGFDNSK